MDEGTHSGSSLGSPRSTSQSSSTDRKSTRLNSSHANISYAVFCLKKQNKDLLDQSNKLIREIFIDDNNTIPHFICAFHSHDDFRLYDLLGTGGKDALQGQHRGICY